jgi:acyl-CoA hydrolase
VTVKVTVEVERGPHGPESGHVKVTEAEVVYVHVDRNNRPIPLGVGRETEAVEAPI